MVLFAYGTLMVPVVMRSVCGHAAVGEQALLPDHRRRRILGEVFPAIVPWLGDCVEGLIYRGLTAEQFSLLDAFEGEMYTRVTVETITGAADKIAQAYVLVPAFVESLSDEPWSLETFLSDGQRDFLADYPGLVAIGDGDDRCEHR